MSENAFYSSDSIENVRLWYGQDYAGEGPSMIRAAGYYDQVNVSLGAFLRRFEISLDDCARALESSDE